MNAGAGGRDLSPYLDKFGYIRVDVTIGGGMTSFQTRKTSASNTLDVIAKFLRDLADDVEHAGDKP